jgi:hypothetical protein
MPQDIPRQRVEDAGPADFYQKDPTPDMIKDDAVKPPKKTAMVVAIINNMPFVQTAFFESATALLFETSRNAELAWMNVKAFPVDFARNWATKRFLNADMYKDIEWMAWLDLDQTFPKQALNMMLEDCIKNDRKVMTAVYFKRNFNNEIVAWKYDGENRLIEPVLDGTVQEIEIMGMGCCIIHRSVLEKIGYPWFKYGSLHEKVEVLATEDIQFCERCKEIGVKLWVHTGIICGHLMTVENVHNKIKVLTLSDGPASGTVEADK